MSLDCSSICHIESRIGCVSMKEIFKSCMEDTETILENCPITIPTLHPPLVGFRGNPVHHHILVAVPCS